MSQDSSKESEKSELDKFDLAANENLLSARAYILFTVKGADDISLVYDPSKLNDMEIIGFLTTAINELEKKRARAELVCGFGDDEDELPEPCKNCKNPECDDCDLLEDD